MWRVHWLPLVAFSFLAGDYLTSHVAAAPLQRRNSLCLLSSSSSFLPFFLLVNLNRLDRYLISDQPYLARSVANPHIKFHIQYV